MRHANRTPLRSLVAVSLIFYLLLIINYIIGFIFVSESIARAGVAHAGHLIGHNRHDRHLTRDYWHTR